MSRRSEAAAHAPALLVQHMLPLVVSPHLGKGAQLEGTEQKMCINQVSSAAVFFEETVFFSVGGGLCPSSAKLNIFKYSQ